MLRYSDPTPAPRPSAGILGVPLYWSPAIAEGVVWLIARSKSYVVMRSDTSVVSDSSVFFTSDRTAVRSTARIAFAWPHEAAVVPASMMAAPEDGRAVVIWFRGKSPRSSPGLAVHHRQSLVGPVPLILRGGTGLGSADGATRV